LFVIVPFYFLLLLLLPEEEDRDPLLEPLEDDLLPLEPLDDDLLPLEVSDLLLDVPLPEVVDFCTGLKPAGGFWADLGGTTTGGRTAGVDVTPLRVHEYWLFAIGL
jgi:hypothetical protein